MSRWNHSLCSACWAEMFPDREPFSLADSTGEFCCRCARWHWSGIYYRGDPSGYLGCAQGAAHKDAS